MKVRIKKLHPRAVVPAYAKSGDAGMDLVATSVKNWDDRIIYGTGIAIEIPEGYVGLIYPRSSNCATTMYLTNSVGVIDSGYRGEIKLQYRSVVTWINPLRYLLRKLFKSPLPISFINNGDIDYKVGERIGQLIIIPYPTIEFEEVEELSTTERGTGGYGSTGR